MAYWLVDNVWSYLKEVSNEDADALHKALRTRPKNYFFDYRYKAGFWDGYNYHFDREKGRVLTGMLSTIDLMGFEFERRIVTPVPSDFHDFSIEGVTYAPKQLSGLQKVLAGSHRGIFDFITSYGKTTLLAGITKMLHRKTLIIVPSVALLHQTHAELKRLLGVDCGRIGAGHNEEDATIKIVIDDTLKRLPKWRLQKLAADVEVLHMDEVHNCTEKLHPFINLCEKAPFRFGFSGTPFDMGKERAAHIIGLFGPVIDTATDIDLVAAGRGVPAHFIFVETQLPKAEGVDYSSLYETCITNNYVFHNTVADLAEKHADGSTSILILVKRIQHGQILVETLKRRGIQCEFTCGKHHAFQREKIKQSFKEGLTKVLVASDIYKEGVDLPCIDVLVMATAGTSPKDWGQRVGRGLRAHPEKDKVLVYDFMFSGNPTFVKHSKARMDYALKRDSSTVFLLGSFLGEPVIVSKQV